MIFYSSRTPLFFLNSTMAMTGAPMSAVTELTGKAPSKPGSLAIRLQSKARAAPVSSVDGIRMRWSLVRKRARARCGTAKPINMMGPQ